MALARVLSDGLPVRTAPRAVTRIGVIDQVRGLALCGMIVFHIAWDLNDWGWTATGPAQSPAWMALGHTVASTFLFVSGFCLVLARPRGTAAALRRIALLAAAAGLITATTIWLFPGDFIFFGIIHCIAVSSLIGLGFAGLPAWVPLLAAGLVAMAPSLFASSGLEGPVWWIVGLARSVPPTLDYRPLLPWLAAVLSGIAAARLLPVVPEVRWIADRAFALGWAGRHSLAIYIVHQPALFGLCWLAAMLHPPIAAGQADFSRLCQAQCVAAGAGAAGCAAGCACMFRAMSAGTTAEAQPSPATGASLQSASEACLRAAPTP